MASPSPVSFKYKQTEHPCERGVAETSTIDKRLLTPSPHTVVSNLCCAVLAAVDSGESDQYSIAKRSFDKTSKYFQRKEQELEDLLPAEGKIKKLFTVLAQKGVVSPLTLTAPSPKKTTDVTTPKSIGSLEREIAKKMHERLGLDS
jgi:hypothetical protein